MCGFTGIISKKNKRFPEKTLKSMTSMIAHRGPDDSGIFFHEDWLAMGFRRLSILDISSKGHQPMLSGDGKYAIVYNGEVYNYRELRRELERKGFTFHTGTDTEVILAAYQAYGQDCVGKFTGMFAFVIADLHKKTAFIARDQLGIKPLFIYEDADHYVFCSEIKSLLPYKTLEPDFDSFNEYLIFRSVVGEHTMFKGVRNLEPGNFAKFAGGSLKVSRYFNLPSTLTHNFSGSFDDACDVTEEAFIKSVELHLRSDVELGMQLSGGVDSSLITAVAAGRAGKKFHTFSISFPDSDECDESEYQKRISERYGTEHHDYPVTEDIFTDNFEKAVWNYEHPLNDPNSVCTYHLLSKARSNVTVMLSGEGADESFLGYNKFTEQSVSTVRKRMLLYRHPKIRSLLYSLTGKPLFNITKYEPAMFALTYADLNLADMLMQGNYDYMTGRQAVSELAGDSILKKIILQDELCDLQQWFWRADRQGMAASMELRVPFCTPEMFSLANSIPHSYHIRNGERKCVLKRIAEKYMDYDQIYRQKIGFGSPVYTWLERQGSYTELFNAILKSDKFRKREFVDWKHFNYIFSGHENGSYREKNSAFLWTYLNLEIWYRIFFEDGWKRLRSS